jgi:TetR/AcrR family fatty acid metabolism transcriptional regulator
MRTKEGNKEKDIIQAAVKVFAEFGYYNAKISKIAEIANVANGSVYVYYKNKEDILLKIFEEIWRPLYLEVVKISNNAALTPSEKLDYLIDLVFDSFIEDPAKAMVFVNEQNHLLQNNPESFTNYYNLFMDEGEAIMKSGIDSGDFNEINLKIFKNFILGGLRNLLHQWAQAPEGFSLNRILQSVKFFCKHGIMK